uniref:Ubiquitin carboxyl-terminal hydrolase n=1 Tax=Oryza brachyantha TaxID=4533 RepID=J3MBV8_ORYBR
MAEVEVEVSVAAAAAEGVLHRRIEFHLARRPHAAVAGGGGGFRMETLNPDAADRAAAGGEGEVRRAEKGEAVGGLDPELSVARIYLGRIGAGLQNLGNTCYLNSVLQCLTYTEPFVAYLQSGKHKSSCRTAGFCALCALQNHVKTALQSTGKIVTPSQIVKNLRCISRGFRNSRQEDAHELMVNLLESMHKCCLPSGVPSESPSAYEKSLVHKIFGGRLRSQVKCTQCSHCSNKFDPFLDLSLDIARATTLVRALQNFTEDELLDGGEKQYQCQRCRKKVVAKKKFTIDKAPYVLTIHLKRFSPFNPREKIDKKVDFQPMLDLKPFISDSKGTDYKYSLYGVLVHAGWNTQSGHYFCFVRTSSGMWHNLDDNQVRQVREADVLKQKAYMLFYVRDTVGNSMPRKDSSTANMPAKKTMPERISGPNGLIQSGVMEAKLNDSSSTYRDKRLHSISNGNSSIMNKTSADYCSKNDGKTEAPGAPENKDLASRQKALAPQIDDATLSAQPKHIASTGPRGTSLSDQSASLIHVIGKQAMALVPSQEVQPKSDGLSTDSGHKTVTSSVANGDATLSKQDNQTSPHHKTFSKLASHVNGTDTGLAAQIFPTKDAIVSNSVVLPSIRGPIYNEKVCGLQKSIKQDDETVKEIPLNKNNIVSELEQDNSRKQASSEVSMKVVADDSCNVCIMKRVDLKSKKLVRYPVMNMWLRPRQLLLHSAKVQKKRKHNRTSRRWPAVCEDMANVASSGPSGNTSEQQPSTSATVPSETVQCTLRGWKRSYDSATPKNYDQLQTSEQQVVGTVARSDKLNLDKRNSISESVTTAELLKLGPSSSANQKYSRNNADATLGAPQHFSVTRELTEVTVPRWDDVAVPNTEARESKCSESKSIGYVLDEWDEEYDRGKAKKIRQSKEDYGGPNPFQEEANFISQRTMKQRSYQARSLNKHANARR